MIFELHDYFKIYYFHFYNNKIKITYNDSNLESGALRLEVMEVLC